MTSSPIPVIDNISTNTTLGAGLFAVSNAGMLAYTPAESAGTRDQTDRMDRPLWKGRLLAVRIFGLGRSRVRA